MKNKHLIVSLMMIYVSQFSWAQDANVAQGLNSGEAIVANPPKATKADEMIKKISNVSDPMQRCEAIAQVAVAECRQPTGDGFKTAAQYLTVLPSLATAFMGGEDSGKMAEMCKLSGLASMIGGLLNSGQGQTCEHSSTACNQVCSASISALRREADKLAASGNADMAQFKLNQATLVGQIEKEQCIAPISQQAALAQQQAQANQQPMAGAEACSQALNGDEEQEIIDCTQAQYANHAECSTLGKTDIAGGIGTYEDGIGLDGREGDGDLPDPEDREDYWNALKNKTSGGDQAGRGGAGAGAGMGGGFGGGAPSNKAGAGGKRAGASMVSGGSESSGGGGGWGSGAGEGDFNKKFAGLGNKKKDLKMLTKKVAGQGLGSAEFGASSDDIWTRVYLRTNTRCTKQLVECAANRSQNPYGSLK